MSKQNTNENRSKYGNLGFYLVLALCTAMIGVSCWFAYTQTADNLSMQLDSALESVNDLAAAKPETNVPKSTAKPETQSTVQTAQTTAAQAAVATTTETTTATTPAVSKEKPLVLVPPPQRGGRDRRRPVRLLAGGRRPHGGGQARQRAAGIAVGGRPGSL